MRSSRSSRSRTSAGKSVSRKYAPLEVPPRINMQRIRWRAILVPPRSLSEFTHSYKLAALRLSSRRVQSIFICWLDSICRTAKPFPYQVHGTPPQGMVPGVSLLPLDRPDCNVLRKAFECDAGRLQCSRWCPEG